LESYVVYLACRIAIFFFRTMPRILSCRLLDLLATLVYCLDPKHRRIADVNLRIAFPGLGAPSRSAIARRSFQNTARNLLEIARLPLLSRENIASLVDYDGENGLGHYLAARRLGKGVLFMTGHFSAWELLPAAHCTYGYPLSFVTRPLDNPALEKFLLRMRQITGNRVIPKRSAARQILETLRSQGDVGVLIDQNTTLQEGAFVDFFGVPAATTTSFARIALHTGAPVIPGFLLPASRGRYRMKFLPALDLIRTGDTDRDVALNTRRFNQVLESVIREHPEAWLWGHKRWKNQPPGTPDLYTLPPAELETVLARLRKAAPAAEPPLTGPSQGREAAR
jgi:KDO2-lipid IV(A) lauroyltransferase